VKPAGLLVFVASLFAAVQLSGQEVHRYPGTDTLLGDRWGWAIAEAGRTGASEFWVGYSIRRLMDEDSYILSDHAFHGSAGERTSLYDLLQIPKPPGLGRNNGYRSNEGTGIFKRMKDIALLFRYSSVSSGDPSIQEARICDMGLLTDLRKLPIFWIGMTNDDQSVERLATLYRTVSSTIVKKRLVEAVGIHQLSDRVYPFLCAVLKSKEPDDVRKNAAFWVSQQRNPAGLQLLMDVAEQDPSTKVREQAVFAVSQIDGDGSTDALITLVRKADNTKVRARAASFSTTSPTAPVTPPRRNARRVIFRLMLLAPFQAPPGALADTTRPGNAAGKRSARRQDAPRHHTSAAAGRAWRTRQPPATP